MATICVRKGVASVVHLPDGASVVLVAGKPFDEDDAAVREFPWAFDFDGDVEDASANPGRKRNVRRPT